MRQPCYHLNNPYTIAVTCTSTIQHNMVYSGILYEYNAVEHHAQWYIVRALHSITWCIVVYCTSIML